jgi:predicted O-methyltransferase YrrM
MFYLTESLKEGRHVGLDDVPGTGTTIYEKLGQDPEREKIFHEAMDATSTFFNPHLAQIKELENVKHLVDLGGGDGTNAIKLARIFPNLTVTVYELPTVCAKAELNIKREKMEGRVKTFAGDFFKDPFPKGFDAVFMSHLNVIWSEERNVALLKRCQEALPKGGLAICYNLMANDAETDPPGAAGMTLFFLTMASGSGMAWPLKSYIDWYKASGFKHRKTYKIVEPYEHTIVVGEKK